MKLRYLLVVLLLACACADEEHGALLIDLRTDLAPGAEFVEVETRVDARPPERLVASAGDSYDIGRRVAEAGDLARGTHEVLVTLFDGAGRFVASRRIEVSVDDTTALLVVINRGCEGLEGCTWRAADAGTDDGGAHDAGTDAGDGLDAGPVCTSTDELCNAMDDDCDGVIDEEGCPCEVATHGGSVYLLCSSAAPWLDASMFCRGRGYHLADIHDDDESAFVASFVSGEAWIGLNDRETEDTFLWESGAAVTYTNWSSTQPDGAGGGGDADCVLAAGRWHDWDCTRPYPYLCETP